VVLAVADGSTAGSCALPVAGRLADIQSVPVRTVQLSNEPVRDGNFAEAILAAAADSQAQLIVMPAYAGEAQPAGAIGDTALAVLLGAACPVVLVAPTRAPDEWLLRRVLTPHDGSPAVSGALRPAAELARQAGAELVVLQAAGAETAAESGSIAPPLYVDQAQHEWPAWSGEFLHRLGLMSPIGDMRVRLQVGRGTPVEETIRMASEQSADLIVLAWRGHRATRGAEFVKAVLLGAPCPVMVTRIPAP
jgi:nucleotide-binding universal stress UspA family protein